MKVLCISSDRFIPEYYKPGNVYNLEVTKEHVHARKTREVQSERDISLQVVRVAGDMHRYFVAGFEGTVFDAMPHRFRKVNRSAAWGQIEIDYSRCKRSVRNQARNIAKEIPSFGKLEKIARGYKR